MYEALILGGGAMYGFMFLGAYKKMISVMEKPKHFAGVSVGAVITSLLATNNSIDFIIDYLNTNNCMDKKDINIFNLWSKYGIDSGITLKKHLSLLIGQITFKELFDETGQILIVTAFNVTKMCIEHFHKRQYT